MSAARVRAVCALAATALLFAGCASQGGSAGPNWKPKPSFNGEGNPPADPQPAEPPAPAPRTSTGTPSPRPSGGTDPNVVATRLAAPTGIAIMPDNTALVGERTTGRIVRVQPRPGQPVETVRTIPGISTTAGGGLLDLALSPNYGEDNLIFAYITTAKDNRVVAFTLHGPITTVLKGIPRGPSGNTGRIAFLGDDTLLIGTGDAGAPTAADNPRQLSGKVLRVTDIGAPAPDNPVAGSPVYASGFHETDGLCPDAATKTTFQTESFDGAGPADPVNVVVPNGTYGWPSARTTDQHPLTTLPPASSAPGGCAVLDHVLYTTSLDGKALLAASIKTTGRGSTALGPFVPTLQGKYGRLRTVVAASDGALWLTTSNRDGKGTPVAADERVLRIVPDAGGGGRNPT
jgi:glucose/arabinose dehydrogenase